MTKNGKIIGMIAVGFVLLVFLGAIIGVINRNGNVGYIPKVLKNNAPVKNKDSEAKPVSEAKLPQASSNINATAEAILLETKEEKNDIAGEISDSVDVFGSQEISDLAETYEENDF